MKKGIFLIISVFWFLQSFATGADSFAFVTNDDGTIDITIKKDFTGFITAELYRENKNGESLIIYEFVQYENTFSERSEPGTCYFLKLYSEDSTVVTTGKKCYSGRKMINKINSNMLILFFLFIVSIIFPFLFRNSFFTNRKNIFSGVFRQLFLMIGEGSGRIVIDTAPENKNSRLSSILSGFVYSFSDLNTLNGEAFEGCGSVDLVKNHRNDSNLFIIHASDGSAGSDYNAYLYSGDKKRMSFSTSLSGIQADSILGRKCLVSIEPFLLGSHKPSGAYLFLIVMALIIVAASIFSTLSLFFPDIHFFSILSGGG